MNRVLALIFVCLATVSCSSNGAQPNPSPTAPAPTASVATTAAQTTTTVPPSSSASSTTTSTVVATTTAPTSTPATTTTAVTTSRAPCSLDGFSLGAKRSDVIPPAIASLAAVRAGQHECYERVVFDFDDENLPDYEISYSVPPFSGTSGMPIAVDGARFIKVRFGTTNARSPDRGSYDGPDVVRPAGFRVINEVHLIEDFEAVVVWVIGIDAEHTFRVGTLTNPSRVYVDVARG